MLKHSQTGISLPELEALKSTSLVMANLSNNSNQIVMKKVSYVVYLDNLKKLKEKI